MDSPASGRGAYGYHGRVGAPYGGRHASPRPSNGGSREYMEKIDSVVGKSVVSPYEAGAGLRQARGRRGCAVCAGYALQRAAGCRGGPSKSGAQEDARAVPNRDNSAGARGGCKSMAARPAAAEVALRVLRFAWRRLGVGTRPSSESPSRRPSCHQAGNRAFAQESCAMCS